MKRQEVAGYQLDLFEDRPNPACHGVTGDGGTESGACGVRQVSSAVDEQRALTQALMDRVAGLANLEEAVRRVCKKQGRGGRGWHERPHAEEMVPVALAGIAGATVGRNVPSHRGFGR